MGTKRSHYLPQTYLKHFLLDNKLYLYKKGEKFFKDNIGPKKRIHEIVGENALINFGLENNIYNPGVEGVTADDLEEIFREYGENTYNNLVSSLNSAKPESFITDEVKERLCLFMAAMRVRTPQFRAEMNEMDEAFLKFQMSRTFGNKKPEDIIRLHKELSGKNISLETATKVVDNFKNNKYTLKYPNAYFIKSALQLIDFYADIFHQMTFTIYKSEDKFFVTSDNPVVFFVPPEKTNFYVGPKALCSPYTELFFPISNNLILHATWRKEEEKVKNIANKYIELFNYNISHHSFDYIFSPKVVDSLRKFTEEHVPFPFKFEIN